MILVDGVQFSTRSSHSHSHSQETDTLTTLMEHPFLASASHSLKAMQERKISITEDCGSQRPIRSRGVYIFQREYAAVDPALVDYVGTDEATTCVGLVIRNRKNGMTSVAHIDSPDIVDIGISQMLSLLVDHTLEVDLDVHLIGGFEDVPPKHSNGTNRSRRSHELEGYSYPLCTKIIETLSRRQGTFHIQTLLILGHNTKRDSEGNACPIFNGFTVETATGSIVPASFDKSTRCPDEIVRRIRIGASQEDPTWDGKLLETYDTRTDLFVIAPASWTLYRLHMALTLRHLSDAEILLTCSTSPSAEGPDFVDNERRQWDYLIKHPEWEYTFPMRQPRIFERTAGGWKRCSDDYSHHHLQHFCEHQFDPYAQWYKVWKENTVIVLDVMDLDLALRTGQLVALTTPSTPNDKIHYISLMIMKCAIPEAFKGTMFDEVVTTKSFLTEIGKSFAKNEKVETHTLLTSLLSTKYKGKRNIHEYIIEMFHLIAKLKVLKLELFEDLLVYLVLIALPAQFSQFRVSYTCQKEKWTLNELISHYEQEDERLQQDKTKSAQLASTSKNIKKRKKDASHAP